MAIKHLWTFAREAGGAAALIPVLQRATGKFHSKVFAKDYALSAFRHSGLEPHELTQVSESEMRRILNEMGKPDVLLTSATSLPQLDMTEKHLWNWARREGIPSVAVLDQWQNYALRFSGTRPREHLAYLPDWVTAMDQYGKNGLTEAGIPAERVVITGQPAFDRLAHLRDTFTAKERTSIRKHLGVQSKAILICFVCECFSRDFADQLGYTEHTVLKDLIQICSRLASRGSVPWHLAIKLHPQNELSEFEHLKNWDRKTQLTVTVHSTEQAPLPMVMASDVVIGMTSTLLLESILLGRPTMSFQPNAKKRDNLMATVVGAIPFIDNAALCQKTLEKLIRSSDFRLDCLKQQRRVQTDGKAAQRVVDLLMNVAHSPHAVTKVETC